MALATADRRSAKRVNVLFDVNVYWVLRRYMTQNRCADFHLVRFVVTSRLIQNRCADFRFSGF